METNRRIEIDNFLKNFAKMLEQNPNIPINNDLFYHQLATYGLTKEEIIKSENPNLRYNNNLFIEWENHFQGNNKLNVYNDARQKSFLQFRSYGVDDADTFKLYVSIPEEYLTEAVYDIFEFIASNDIKTASKVANNMRSDVIVLRIFEEDDAKKIINYINNLQIFKNNSKLTNPFLPRNGFVGMGYDKHLSFNSSVSTLLCEYFIEKRKKKNFDEVNINDFAHFVKELKNKLSNDKNYITQFLSREDVFGHIQRLKVYDTQNQVLVNYIHIFDLIEADLNNNLNFDDYFNKVDNYRNQSLNKFEEQQIENTLNQTEKISPTIEPNKIDSNVSARILLNDYIIYAALKYGMKDVSVYLGGYIRGQEKCITRDNNFRNMFKQELPAQLVQSIIGNNIEEYVKNICLIFGKSTFYKICNETLNKYGEQQLRSALLCGLNRDFKKFTNNGDEKLREKLIYFLPQNEYVVLAKEYLQNLNKEIQRKI